MNERQRQRCVYVSARQKKKLIEFVTSHPKLISCKVTQDFSYKDAQNLWQELAVLCNSIPGARKTWRQWKKTWHDLRSKTKKRQAESNGSLPNSLEMLTPAEQEALGINTSATYQESTEFVMTAELEPQDNFHMEGFSNASISEPESPREEKVFASSAPKIRTRTTAKMSRLKNHTKHSTEHSDNCYFDCGMLSVNEERKIQIKEDYLNFKKDYLRQKLRLLKEQTEALKTIAKELGECNK